MARHDPLWQVIKNALLLTCPRCNKAPLFRKGLFSISLKEKCTYCDMAFHEHDAGDGPAVFVIFILGFTIIPLAVIIYQFYDWPEWIHYTLWPALILFCILGLLKPLKSLIIALKYHFDAGDDLSK